MVSTGSVRIQRGRTVSIGVFACIAGVHAMVEVAESEPITTNLNNEQGEHASAAEVFIGTNY